MQQLQTCEKWDIVYITIQVKLKLFYLNKWGHIFFWYMIK